MWRRVFLVGALFKNRNKISALLIKAPIHVLSHDLKCGGYESRYAIAQSVSYGCCKSLRFDSLNIAHRLCFIHIQRWLENGNEM